MNNSKQARAEKLYSQTAISKSIWIVVIPALLSAFMVGLYSFADQLLIQKFVPETKIIFDETFAQKSGEIYAYLSNADIPHITNSMINDLISSYNNHIGVSGTAKLDAITANSIVSLSTVAFNPLIIFANSIVFLIPVGSSIYYTKIIAKKYEKTGKDLWATAWWSSLTLAIVASICLMIAASTGLLNNIVGFQSFDDQILQKMNGAFEYEVNGSIMKTTYTQAEILQEYFKASTGMSTTWAQHYVYIYAGGTFIMAMYTLLSFLIRAEGRNNYVLVFAIIANIANIALDYIFIKYFKMGVLGGAVATIIGWIINLGGYLWYCFWNTRKESTWLSLKHLFKFKFDKGILGPIILLGFSGFIRSFTVAISVFFVSFILVNASFSDAVSFQYYWSKAQPVVLLFLFGMFGISDGARSLMAYNYSRREFARCKQTVWWSFLATMLYGLISYVIVLIFTKQFAQLLSVETNKWDNTIYFMRIMMLRVIFFSPIIVSLLIFQGTNNIKMSTIAAISEPIISFVIVMSISFLIANYSIYPNYSPSRFEANSAILIGYVINSLIASIGMFAAAIIYLYKYMPKVDQSKLSFSRKIEHKFFENAKEDEIQYRLKNNLPPLEEEIKQV